jgi:hypothetical protein
MRRPFTQLYVHLVWATWDRLPLITGTTSGIASGKIWKRSGSRWIEVDL